MLCGLGSRNAIYCLANGFKTNFIVHFTTNYISVCFLLCIFALSHISLSHHNYVQLIKDKIHVVLNVVIKQRMRDKCDKTISPKSILVSFYIESGGQSTKVTHRSRKLLKKYFSYFPNP